MPSATSSAIEPVGMTSIGGTRVVAEAHDRALAELLLDLRHHRVEGLRLVCHSSHAHTYRFS